MSKYVTAAEAVKVIKSGDRVYLQAAAPTILANALTERASELRNVEICHLHTEAEARYANPELAESFHINSFSLELMYVTP
jgi:acyl-CoA hydrolase